MASLVEVAVSPLTAEVIPISRNSRADFGSLGRGVERER